MVLTKHLYRRDEVVAAFLYSLKQRRQEAHFWLYELEVSKLKHHVKGILLVAWLMRVGLRRLSWLHHWCGTHNFQDSRILLCEELLSLTERDSSIWWVIWHGATSETMPTITLKQAILENNLCAAWWYLSRFDKTTFWNTVRLYTLETPVEQFLDSLQYDLGSYELFGRCVATALLVAHKTLDPSSSKDIIVPLSEGTRNMYRYIETIPSITSIKEHRLYPIPWECLFGMTKRGSGISTLSELHNLEKNLIRSPVWIEIMEPYMNETKTSWLSEDLRTLFYEQNFPYENGDIPDEWSVIEKQKSHGDIIPPVGQPTFGRWWRNWTIQERLYVWNNHSSAIQTWMNETLINLHETVFDTLQGLYEEQYTLSLTNSFEKMLI